MLQAEPGQAGLSAFRVLDMSFSWKFHSVDDA